MQQLCLSYALLLLLYQQNIILLRGSAIPVSAAILISSHLTHLIEHIFVDENQPGIVLARSVADCYLYTSYTYECQDIGQPQSSTVYYSTIPVSSLLPVEPNIG